MNCDLKTHWSHTKIRFDLMCCPMRTMNVSVPNTFNKCARVAIPMKSLLGEIHSHLSNSPDIECQWCAKHRFAGEKTAIDRFMSNALPAANPMQIKCTKTCRCAAMSVNSCAMSEGFPCAFNLCIKIANEIEFLMALFFWPIQVKSFAGKQMRWTIQSAFVRGTCNFNWHCGAHFIRLLILFRQAILKSLHSIAFS